MNWRGDADTRLAVLGDDPERLRQAAELAEACGTWRDGCVLRVEMRDGRAAWLWRSTGDGALMCVALAPMGSLFDVECVEGGGFFTRAANPPDGWVTKASAGLTGRDWSRPHKRAVVWDGAEWCVGLWKVEGRPQARTVRLCKVARVENGNLVSVVMEDGAPAVEVAKLDAARWIPQDAYTAGYEAMWMAGNTHSGGYGVHVNRAKKLAG